MEDEKRPLIFGEVLFDCFDDENILGGAPFNVAWHLCGLGLDPFLISAVGDDDLGRTILSKMKSFGMDTEGIQIIEGKQTGRVIIKHPEGIGSHAFEILDDQAYDHIGIDEVKEIIREKRFSFLYHGSLAIRNNNNKDVLDHLLGNLDVQTFVDINMRPPFWNQEMMREVMERKDHVKLNEPELERLNFLDQDRLDNDSRKELSELGIRSLLLTLAEKGAKIYFDDGRTISKIPEEIEGFVDSIGAGDAFSSVYIYGLINGWEEDLILERALDFASDICKARGAIVDDKEFYRRFLDEWKQ